MWQRLSNNTHHVISFRNKEDFDAFLVKLEADLKKYVSKEKFGLFILKFFEEIHWIKILDETELSFQFLISEQDHKRERELLLNYFSKNYEVIVKNQIYSIQTK